MCDINIKSQTPVIKLRHENNSHHPQILKYSFDPLIFQCLVNTHESGQCNMDRKFSHLRGCSVKKKQLVLFQYYLMEKNAIGTLFK